MKRKKSSLGLIEKALDRSLTRKASEPPQIHEALRYAVLGGGKRFRPALVLSACEAVGGDPEAALLPACAVEFIHCYSLIHDDLPALDNDDVRRGKPTCHRQFGEAIAILAGDALLTRAFELLSEVRPSERAVSLIQELSKAAGTEGMIGGQVADILHSGNEPAAKSGAATLDYISIHKTGRLIQASAVMGALVGTRSEAKRNRIRRYGGAVGLAFQVVDDIMDGDGYLRVMNPGEARKKIDHLLHQACLEVRTFGRKGDGLIQLAGLLLKRSQEESPKNVPVA
ncbi:MAG: polyprenyl synthetase family protein [Candidatus Omnitrophica bacterium]|nr:polyprenyl synthetase family protein [Candidatus Omnitrophota bacterium]